MSSCKRTLLAASTLPVLPILISPNSDLPQQGGSTAPRLVLIFVSGFTWGFVAGFKSYTAW